MIDTLFMSSAAYVLLQRQTHITLMPGPDLILFFGTVIYDPSSLIKLQCATYIHRLLRHVQVVLLHFFAEHIN